MTLREYLASTKIADDAFAARVDASEGAVRKWKSGERIPRPEQMARIVEATAGQVTATDFYAAAVA